MRAVKNGIVWLCFLLIAWLIPKPKKKGRKIITNAELKNLLRGVLGKACQLFLVDKKYKVPTLENMKKFLKEDKTDLYKYIPEFFDCDDFSFRLMGQFSIPGWSDITFGIATSMVHAYNVLVALDSDNEMQVYLVEPQTDELILAKEEKRSKYQTYFIMM